MAGLKWEWDGFHFVAPWISDQVRAKLGDIFDSWRIGWHAKRTGDKGYISVYVPKRQFDRVGFKLEKVEDVKPHTDG